MNVSLTPELEKLVGRNVASGRYGSASEVVRDALRLFEQREELHRARIEQLRRDIGVGVADLDQGRSKPFDAAAVRRIKAEGRRRLKRVMPR